MGADWTQGTGRMGLGHRARNGGVFERAAWRRWTVIVAVAVACLGGGLASEALTVGTHVFEFGGVTYNRDGTSTWTYSVTSGRKPAISHWVLELDPAIFGRDSVVRCSETHEVGSDPRTEIYGLKFGAGYRDGESRQVSFTLDRWYSVVDTRVGVKAGKDSEVGGFVPGPGPERVVENAAPTAVDDQAGTDENESVEIDVLANDRDDDGAIARTTLTITQPPASGTVSVDPTSGNVTYTPAAGRCGEDSFRYRVKDDDGADSNEASVGVAVACNESPTANDDAATTDESTAVVIPVLGNDEDSDGALIPESVSIVRSPGFGSLSVHPTTGVITYTPATGSCGDDSFEYTIRDDDGASSNRAVVTVSVLCSDPPLAIDDLYNVAEGAELTVPATGVLANDRETPGRPLYAILISPTMHGAVMLHADGSFSYVHDGSETVDDAFTYVADDERKSSNLATVRLVIAPTNDGPTAADDEAGTEEDRAVEIEVLANDSDPDHDTLSVDWVGDAAHGRVTNLGTRVQYAPEADFHGSDSFTYGVSDGHGGTSAATVMITVDSVNDAPVVQADSASTAEDAAITLFVLANDRDPEGDALVIRGVTQPENGLAESDGRTVTYTPNPDYNGVDTFTYTASDPAGGAASALVTVAVVPTNDAPRALDGSGATDEDVAVEVDVLSLAEDPDGDALALDAVSQPEHGTTAVVGGRVLYTPDRDFHGDDVFAYTVSDGHGGTATAQFSVTVRPVNDAPVAQDDSAVTDEAAAVSIPVLENDRDADGDALSLQLSSMPAHGTAVVVGSAIVYEPAAGYHGVDSFEYVVADGRGGSGTARVTIDVATVNHPPVAAGGHVDLDEDTATTIALLVNDSDPDGDPLTLESVTEPQNGALERSGPDVTYYPYPGFHGEDAFTYTVSDGRGGTSAAVITIDVIPVNDIPLAQDDSAATAEDATVRIAVLNNDSDPDGDSLAILSVTQPLQGRTAIDGAVAVYTPNPDFFGTDGFEYTVTDGLGGTATARVSVRVDSVNDAPIAVADVGRTLEDVPASLAILSNDVDADGDALTVESLSQPLHGTATLADGTVVYSPSLHYFGEDSFTYVAADGKGGSSLTTVTVTVVAANDFPMAQDDNAVTPEEAAVMIAVLSNDHDADGDALTVQAVSQPAHGTVTNAATGVTYTPAVGFRGSDVFTYTVSDGRGGSASASVSVTVTPVNHHPVAQDDSAVSDGGAPVLIEVLENDSDPDGDFLLVQSMGGPAHGTLVNGRTAISYIPDVGFQGVDTFSYIVSDGNGGSAVASVSVAVANPNFAPVAHDDSGVTDEGVAVEIEVLDNDSDPDDDRLRIESVTQPSSGRAAHDGSKITYRPLAGTSGVDVLTYTVSDGRGATATASVLVVVVSVNDAPIAQNDSATTEKDVVVLIPVLENDTDDGGDALVIVSAGPALRGTVTVDGSGVRYVPEPGFVGTDSFTYTVRDSEGGGATGTVTVGVSDVAGGGGAASLGGCEGRVIINEVAWAGSPADAGDEWIELRNLGTSPVDLTGWTVQWRRTRPTAPEDAAWKIVQLSGVLDGSAGAACDGEAASASNVRLSKADPSGATWDVAYQITRELSGYFLLERTRDTVVSDVPGHGFYDSTRSPVYGLSDLGEVILLVDAGGDIVDTANASSVGRDEWAAGSASTFGSMERVDPLGPDVATNWATNLGVIASGYDAKERPLRATPGAPNSPRVEVLIEEAGVAPVPMSVGAPLSVSFALSRDARRATGWPWIVTTRPGLDDAGGAGGQSWATCSFSGQAESGDSRYRLEIGTGAAAPGVYLFWIAYGQGRSLLVPVLLTP